MTFIITDILLGLFIVMLFADACLSVYNDHKEEPIKKQKAQKEAFHNEAQKGIDYIKSFLTQVIITVAKDEHFNTGNDKFYEVKNIVKSALLKAHFDVPDVIINALIQSFYETSKQFIQSSNIDSRLNNTKGADQMSEEEIKNKIMNNK